MKTIIIIISMYTCSSCGIATSPVIGATVGGYQLTEKAFQEVDSTVSKVFIAPFTFILGTPLGAVCGLIKALTVKSGSEEVFSTIFPFHPSHIKPYKYFDIFNPYLKEKEDHNKEADIDSTSSFVREWNKSP